MACRSLCEKGSWVIKFVPLGAAMFRRVRELNSRPQPPTTESIHCFFTFFFFSSSPLRTDEDAATASLIDLALGVQTELLKPAYCATIGICA
jgi:hypothetical protein